MADELSLLGLGELLASLAATFVAYTWTTQRLLARTSPNDPGGPSARLSLAVPLRRSVRDAPALDRGREAA